MRSTEDQRQQNLSAQQFFVDLLKEMQTGRKVSSSYTFIRDPKTWEDPGSLSEILNVDRDCIGEKGLLSIEILEDVTENLDVRSSWKDFK
jgi:hypothetical protein